MTGQGQTLELQALEGFGRQLRGHAGDFRLYGGAARTPGDQAHLADGGVPPEAAHCQGSGLVGRCEQAGLAS